MGLIAKNTGGGQFAPVPAGSHAARCCWVIDLGTQTEISPQFGTKLMHKVLIGWELPEEIMQDGERAGEPFFISRRYTLSLGERANLRKDLAGWRGRDFTESELEAFDLRNVLDKPCLLTVTHKQATGKVYANVVSVSPLPKAMKCPDRVNPLRAFDMEKPDQETFDALPEWVQKICWASLEMSGKPQLAAAQAAGDDVEPDIDDDEVPF